MGSVTNGTELITNNQFDVEQLNNCWHHLFTSIFVANELNYIFMNTTTIQNNSLNHCDKLSIHSLIDSTKTMLLSTSKNIVSINSFHNILLLRRIIMILSTNNHIEINLNEILHLFNSIEIQYNKSNRYNYTLFNIHAPRSGGTTICSLFKSIKTKYNQSISKLHLNWEFGYNCNVGDGVPFTWFKFDGSNIPKPKTCNEQYKMTNNFSFVARESPLYPISNVHVQHPELCDKFIYMLSFRSPIERILSWLRTDVKFRIISQENDSIAFDNLSISYFYSHLFTENKSSLINRYRLNKNRFLTQYSNNAMTRWLGYEHPNKLLYGSDIRRSINASVEKINNNDIHFYNAMNLLLKIDYVLNFASYPDDSSALNAIKYGRGYNVSMASNYTLLIDIHNRDSMWNILMKHLNEYFNVSYFSWTHTNKKIAAISRFHPTKMSNDLTPKDWNVLYRQNYWDFKLYSLTKWIQKVDAQFYNKEW